MKPINGSAVTAKIWAIFNQARSVKANRGKLSPVQRYVGRKYGLFGPTCYNFGGMPNLPDMAPIRVWDEAEEFAVLDHRSHVDAYNATQPF